MVRKSFQLIVSASFIIAVTAAGMAPLTMAQTREEVLTLRATDWARVENARYGFVLSYPGGVFAAKPGVERDEARLFISHDGAARLGVATFENEDGWSLHDYRRLLLATNYDGARIEFAPVRRNWFIISGTRGGMHFYERVSFTCGGRLINSWALLYPDDQRRFYDRIVEAVARSYTPGVGPNGRCD